MSKVATKDSPCFGEAGMIANFLVLFLLMAGLGVGLYLFKNPQIFKAGAANPSIVFKSSTGEPLAKNKFGVPVSSSSAVKIELTSTLGSPKQSTAAETVKTYTVSYKLAENPVDLSKAQSTPYTQEPTIINYIFKNTSLGQKFIWVEFKDSAGKTNRKSAQLELTGAFVENCVDSDGGKNPNVAGTIYLKGSKWGDEFCNFNDQPPFKSNQVREYWCKSPTDTTPGQEWIACPGGCENGACVTTTGATAKTVFAYYYGWYSSGRNFLHWGDFNHKPPSDLYSAYYPVLGPYGSNDLTTIDLHMQWLKAARVDVILISFWGIGDRYTPDIKQIMNKANQYGIKVAFLLEPKRAEEHISNIKYLIDTYGNDPAFYKTSRSTLYGKNTNPRPTFWIYQPMMAYQGSGLSDEAIKQDYRTRIDSIRGTSYDSIVLIENTKEAMLSNNGPKWDVDQYHSDGMFNYDANVDYSGKTFAKSSDYITAVQVAPGFDNRKIGGNIVVDRNRGFKYDELWREVAAQKPEWVAVLTFNEWGESSQIEPAKPYAGYADYQGHYSYQGSTAYGVYIIKTAYWVNNYKGK